MATEIDSRSDDSAEDMGTDMFQEPADFRPATPPPTMAYYQMRGTSSSHTDAKTSDRLTLHLVGSHPLWGHHLWNAAPTLSDYLTNHSAQLVLGRAVLELGAASGLPSLVCARLGAGHVVTTDYPDADLMCNLEKNVTQNCEGLDTIKAQGYLWGADTAPLLRDLPNGKQYYDVLLLSDLIFNHQAHDALLDTCDQCLPPSVSGSDGVPERPPIVNDVAADVTPASSPCALVFFTHHLPHKAHKDMGFFETARRRNWDVRKVGEWTMDPMFPEDPGDEVVRSTVHGWCLSR